MTTMTPEDQAWLAEIRADIASDAGELPGQETLRVFLLRLLDAATAGKPAGGMVTRALYDAADTRAAAIAEVGMAYKARAEAAEQRVAELGAELRAAIDRRIALQDDLDDARTALTAAEGAREADREWFGSEARRYASHYPQSSDGQTTFLMLADRIENGRPAATQENTDDAG